MSFLSDFPCQIIDLSIFPLSDISCYILLWVKDAVLLQTTRVIAIVDGSYLAELLSQWYWFVACNQNVSHIIYPIHILLLGCSFVMISSVPMTSLALR